MIRGPSSAASTIAATSPAPTTNLRMRSGALKRACVRGECRRLNIGDRGFRQCRDAHRPALPDAWIEKRVERIGQDVRQHEHEGDQQHRSLDHRIVPRQHRIQRQLPQPGQRKDVVDHDCPAQRIAELHAHHRDDGDRRVLQHMTDDNRLFTQPFRRAVCTYGCCKRIRHRRICGAGKAPRRSSMRQRERPAAACAAGCRRPIPAAEHIPTKASQRSLAEKSRISITPSQKSGIEMPKMLKPSRHTPRRPAAWPPASPAEYRWRPRTATPEWPVPASPASGSCSMCVIDFAGAEIVAQIATQDIARQPVDVLLHHRFIEIELLAQRARCSRRLPASRE